MVKKGIKSVYVVIEWPLGTINGVIHVIDRVLGVPYQSVYERLSTDPNMRY